MAASATPMTRVLVSRVRPRYGASSRSATTSTTSTLADAPKTKAAAVYRPSPGDSGRATTISPDSLLTAGSCHGSGQERGEGRGGSAGTLLDSNIARSAY